MKIFNRPYDESAQDFQKMWLFLQQDYAQKKDDFVWLFSRLGDWKYGLWNEKKYFPSFFRKNAQLWVNGFDQLLGFALSEDGENVFFVFTQKGYEYLTADILDWTVEHWGPRHGRLIAEAHEHQGQTLDWLQAKGFRSLGAVATTRAYDLPARADETIQLPPGYKIMRMSENMDFHSKALLNLNAYQSKEQASELDLLRFEYSRENPAYDPAFDFSVVTEKGAHVASCVGFNDPAYGVAEVEKVCTHSQYRRQGLAEAVIRACFQALKERGIRRAYITGYGEGANALYESLGPCRRWQWSHYEWPQS